MAHKCLAGCGQNITWRFAICSNCEEIYGRSPYDWPDWLSYLWREEQRERRRNARANENEISFTELEEEFDMYDD